jgi:hypothetical protein
MRCWLDPRAARARASCRSDIRDRQMKFRAVRQGEMESTAAVEHHSGECLGCTWHDIKVAPARGREPRLRRMVYLDRDHPRHG